MHVQSIQANSLLFFPLNYCLYLHYLKTLIFPENIIANNSIYCVIFIDTTKNFLFFMIEKSAITIFCTMTGY